MSRVRTAHPGQDANTLPPRVPQWHGCDRLDASLSEVPTLLLRKTPLSGPTLRAASTLVLTEEVRTARRPTVDIPLGSGGLAPGAPELGTSLSLSESYR